MKTQSLAISLPSMLPFMALLVVLPYPGTVAARLLCLFLMLGIASVSCFRQPELSKEFPPGGWGIAIWILLCVLSLFYSNDVGYSLKELKNEVVYPMCAFFSFFVMGQRHEHAQTLLRTLAAGFLLTGTIAIYAWFANHMMWEDEGIQGGVGSFSAYIVTSFPAFFWLSLSDVSPHWRRLGIALLVFALVLAFITLQRAVWPALAAEFLIAFYLLRKIGSLQIPARVTTILVVGVLAASIVALSLSNRMRGIDGIMSLVPSKQTFEKSVREQDGNDGDARLPYWPSIIRTIVEHPVIGTGFGQGMMKKVYPELVPPNFPALWHAHNVVLNSAIQLGIPGAFAFLLMLFGIVRYYWRFLTQNPHTATAAIGGIMLVAGVLLRNQTNDFFRRDLAILFWSLTGIFSALSIPKKTAR